MFVQSKQNLINTVIAATAALTSGYKVRLFTGTTVPSVNSVIGDFTEADYTGYTPGGLGPTDFTGAAWQSQGAAVSYSFVKTFQPTGTAVGNVITGYYFVTGDMTPELIGAERFTSPISMQSPADQISIAVPFNVADGLVPGVVY
jgi:hypothetical protein